MHGYSPVDADSKSSYRRDDQTDGPRSAADVAWCGIYSAKAAGPCDAGAQRSR
jgi:hypothetical protein